MITNYKTGFVYHPSFLEHTLSGHPENKDRLVAIMDELKSSGLLSKLHEVPCREAAINELANAHTVDYINSVKEKCKKGSGNLDADTYVTKDSYKASIMAAGGLIDLCQNVLDGKIDNGFAFVRPPGHHALKFRAMGFCIFNNVAIAAKTILQNTEIDRVAIIDFDVHHGNGTQAILEEEENILYVSSHQYPYYPGTGNYTENGRGDGIWTTINFPLQQGVGDEGFKAVYEDLAFPIIKRFDPQIILVSAGYDAHWQDPLAGLNLSLEGYSWISRQLVELADEICNGKIVFSLEGGYNLDVLKHGVSNSVKALLHDNNFIEPIGKSPHSEPNIEEYIKEMKNFFHVF